jgi:flavin-dependent dehydrogenase
MPSARTEGKNLPDRDVIILGGGPAGCATAISLREHAPSLSVALVEASSYDRPRIGEVLPALARVFLDHLRAWEAFQAERYRAAHSTTSIWGDTARRENHFIYSTHGAGWHVDRTRFDALLAREAAARRVDVRLATRLVEAKRMQDAWRVRLSDGTEWRARFVVDATGRKASFARGRGARTLAFDRLAGFARFFTKGDNCEPGTLVEAFSQGWWYTALAGERRVVVCMTDVDVARSLALHEEARWLGLLSETLWIKRSVGGGALTGKPVTCAANSVRLDTVSESDWIAVGDAASAFDPLSSQGIVKSLRSGIFASYAIADWLGKSDNKGLARYEGFVRREFDNYRRVHARYCAEERRWPDSAFWQRRHRSLESSEID